MKRKSFTLVEILVALIILSILASLSVAIYQKTVDTNNERICAQNLKVLQAAIDIFAVENDTIPAVLSQLTPRHIYLAQSRVIGERKENFLSIALRKMFSTEPALADPETEGELFRRRYLSGKKEVFCDPADNNCNPNCVPSPSCVSYNFVFTEGVTIVTDINGRRSLKKDSISALIQDTNPRHKGKLGSTLYPLGVTPGGRVGKVETGGYIVQFLVESL